MKASAILDGLCRMLPDQRRCWKALRRMRWPQGSRLEGLVQLDETYVEFRGRTRERGRSSGSGPSRVTVVG